VSGSARGTTLQQHRRARHSEESPDLERDARFAAIRGHVGGANAGGEPIDVAEEPPQDELPSASTSSWPPGAEPYYRPSLIAAISASVGVAVGSAGPWVTSPLVTINGLDGGKWAAAALALGAVSCVALLVELCWPRLPFNPRWAAPLAWAVAVAGVACLSYAIRTLITIMSIPRANLLGISADPAPGWGIWLLVVSSAVLLGTAAVVANQLSKYAEALPGPQVPPQVRWAKALRQAAMASPLIVAIAVIAYFGVLWDNNSDRTSFTPSPPKESWAPPSPTASDRWSTEHLVEWETRLNKSMTRLIAAMTGLSTSVTAFDYKGTAAKCTEISKVNSDLTDLLPGPDAKVTAKLKDLSGQIDAAVKACQAIGPNSFADDYRRFADELNKLGPYLSTFR